MVPSDTSAARRRFLKLLAASPLFSVAALPPGVMDAIFGTRRTGFAPMDGIQEANVIGSVQDALNVMDFEAVAKKNILPEHWAYLATGVDDDSTMRANREGFTRYQLRMRMLADISKVDMSVQLFGTKWSTPIVMCPVASLKGFHTEGEKGAARAARSKGHLQVLSTRDLDAGRGRERRRAASPVWYQLYARDNWNETLKIVKRVETAGARSWSGPSTCWAEGNGRPTDAANPAKASRRRCARTATRGARSRWSEGLAEQAGEREGGGRTVFTWDGVKRLKDATSMKLFVKGILTREDAELAIAFGADGIFVSNHGGRAGASGRSTIESLPEVAAGVDGRIPIILDSGVRRGTDIFKALALGATAVGIGRPYVWGLGAFGQEGVETVLDILRRELQMVMRQTGVTSIDQDHSRRHWSTDSNRGRRGNLAAGRSPGNLPVRQWREGGFDVGAAGNRLPGLAVVLSGLGVQAQPAAQDSAPHFTISGTSTVRNWSCPADGVLTKITPGKASPPVPGFPSGVQSADHHGSRQGHCLRGRADGRASSRGPQGQALPGHHVSARAVHGDAVPTRPRRQGKLTIAGVTKPVSFDVKLVLVSHRVTGRRRDVD